MARKRTSTDVPVRTSVQANEKGTEKVSGSSPRGNADGGPSPNTSTTAEITVTDDKSTADVKDAGVLSSKTEATLEASLRAAGCDVEVAKANLKKLKASFPGTSRKGDDGKVTVLTSGLIPDGAMNRWIDENFSPPAIRSLLFTLAREWEQE